MGCCYSENHLPDRRNSTYLTPHEEGFIQVLEKNLLHRHYLPISRTISNVNDLESSLLRNSSEFPLPDSYMSWADKGKTLVFSYILVSNSPVSLKQQQLTEFLGHSFLDFHELEALVDFMIEVSIRIHPFIVSSAYISHYNLHHYISSLEVAKSNFKRKFLENFRETGNSLKTGELRVLLSSAGLRCALYREFYDSVTLRKMGSWELLTEYSSEELTTENGTLKNRRNWLGLSNTQFYRNTVPAAIVNRGNLNC